jgi:hypothetical protein
MQTDAASRTGHRPGGRGTRRSRSVLQPYADVAAARLETALVLLRPEG